METMTSLERLRYAVGGAHGVALADVGAWDARGVLWAGFFDSRCWRLDPKVAAGVVRRRRR